MQPTLKTVFPSEKEIFDSLSSSKEISLHLADFECLFIAGQLKNRVLSTLELHSLLQKVLPNAVSVSHLKHKNFEKLMSLICIILVKDKRFLNNFHEEFYHQ